MLTGGGTAGHVMPNIALLPALRAAGFDISYMGGISGMEKEIVQAAGLPYYGISSGKLRRYLSAKNITDALRVVRGVGQARRAIRHIKPDIVFSKGGFVAVPVVLAARLAKVPVVIHESDITVGLANKLCIPHAAYVCCVFPETMRQIPKAKAILAGAPIRQEILEGSRIKGLAICNFPDEKPVIMVMGGSQGSVTINNCVGGALDGLLADFNMVHLCGAGNVDKAASRPGYVQMEYAGADMGHLYAAADIVVSRAGANSLGELLALAKPNILIPLSLKASRGDQILNAQSFARQGFSVVIDEDGLDSGILAQTVRETFNNRGKYAAAMKKSGAQNGIDGIVAIIKKVAKK
jgi:UDP-N-acetylglucosamine--N-acetylmuramyl-(pentapeptide) pyrophosphoryl-undecaprenol N-acetylglucosamine transferase